MKRSKRVRLIALGSLPLVLSACGERPTRVVSEVKRFQDVDHCAMTGINRQVCLQAWLGAQQHHYANAPRFVSLEACEEVFQECDTRNFAGNFVPRMEGFALTVDRQVYADGSDDTSGAGSTSTGGTRFYDYTDTEPHYSTEAIYHERDGRNAFKVTSLTEQVAAGNQYAGLDPNHPTSTPFSSLPHALDGTHPATVPAGSALHPTALAQSPRPFAIGSHNGFVSRASARGGFSS
ncbi:DUF1190 domain-containing protein [Pseudomonas sp. AL 58]|uniref:DUF1190 domain-containing protein n=1 Tax=Pseudomonas sp. AL 58 TaxID=3104275 RepID=UPI002E9872D3|nr:DUF1190 domain-containing protein [Pseudomonas sp. AL 58]